MVKTKEQIEIMLNIHKQRLGNSNFDQKMLKGAIKAYEWCLE